MKDVQRSNDDIVEVSTDALPRNVEEDQQLSQI
jgi:hypothetical protein